MNCDPLSVVGRSLVADLVGTLLLVAGIVGFIAALVMVLVS